jgi:hypothetical protein
MNPNCTKCKHFYITFDQATPKGCRAYGIKSAQLPSVIVKSANNGNNCIGFEEKQKNIPKKKDLNDAKYW